MKIAKFGGITLLAVLVSSYTGYSLADSIVTTSKGTFRCDNSCVVDDDGNVTDSAGGHVWKKVGATAPREP